MSASSDEIPLSLSLPRPLQASPVCEALQYMLVMIMDVSSKYDMGALFCEELVFLF